jgi:DNA-binding transcriptional LysR family regulator
MATIVRVLNVRIKVHDPHAPLTGVQQWTAKTGAARRRSPSWRSSAASRGPRARLNVSRSALSHTLRRLEEEVGVQLLARSTRNASTTQAGERLLERLGPAIGEITSAVEQLGASAGHPSGHIRISASDEAGRRVIAPVLPKFVQAYPEIVVEVLVEQAFTNIVERRLDA